MRGCFGSAEKPRPPQWDMARGDLARNLGRSRSSGPLPTCAAVGPRNFRTPRIGPPPIRKGRIRRLSLRGRVPLRGALGLPGVPERGVGAAGFDELVVGAEL